MGVLRNLRWPLVAVSLAVTLGLLLGGSVALRYFRVDSPLHNALSQDPAVLSYSLDEAGSQPVLHVRLSAVPDLAETYHRIDAVARRTLGTGHYRIELEDRRTPALTEAYHRIHFALQEGLQRGTYDEMARHIDAETKGLSLSGQRVTVDDGRIFVQLQQGTDYLYAVLERPQAQRGEVA